MTRLQQSGHALGTDCILTIIVDEDTGTLLLKRLWAEIAGFEARFSRFKADSELTAVNQTAGTPHKISPDFHALMQTALKFGRETHGLYNPLVLPALQSVGYKGSWPTPTVVSKETDFSTRQVGAVSDIVLKSTQVTLPANTALDFGGIGKGYLLDQLADSLDAEHVKHYWLSLGGDIVMRGFNEEDQQWRIGIASAHDQDQPISFVANTDGRRMAIATSGTAKRKGAGWHHIIDPRSGKSAVTDIVSSTVVHESATAADVYAKCLVIIGSDAASDFATLHDFTESYILQLDDESVVDTIHQEQP